MRDRLLALPQYVLPHHALSRVVHWATRRRAAWWKNALIRWFTARYRVDLSEAADRDACAYPDFNAFFTRALRAGARPLPDDAATLASPVDGTVSAFGRLEAGRLVQAKGVRYGVEALLGGSAERAAPFGDGTFVTLYLSPRDYHRVHMPLTGELREMVHVPGRLFSVAAYTTRAIPRLFARNERVAAIFDTAVGPMTTVLVGAMLVSSISTAWSGTVTPPRGRAVRSWRYGGAEPAAPELSRGEELGRFNMGSTVIVLLGGGEVHWAADLAPGARVRMGQALGRVAQPAPAEATG
ncbi:MAG: phosphatidylserine decarboxylase [Gammaproteobacteria bacterium]|nr:phosphatidylserine decarboxylase [Gammaproteobacteria bacterium]